MNEALATIAEIATRTYYVSKPPSSLPFSAACGNLLYPLARTKPRVLAVPVTIRSARK